MPPKIKRENTAKVTSGFMDLVCDMYEMWAMKNIDLIRAGANDPSLAFYTQTAARMRPIVRRQSPSPRDGYDYEVTRFSGLPYTSFEVVQEPHEADPDRKILWLVGRTRHVTATYYNARSRVAGELGCYNVYIPETIATSPDLFKIHMIPQRNLRSEARHYHHYIRAGYEGAVRHPLTYHPGNCWGDYQGTMNSLITIPDYPELFRQLYRHLSTYGDRPPMRSLDFDTTTPEA